MLAALTAASYRSIDYHGVEASRIHPRDALVWVFLILAVAHVLVQYSNTDVPGVVVGYACGVVGAAALVVSAGSVHGWNVAVAAGGLLAGAALLGAWYLNQPGLKTWALARLTTVGLVTAGAAALAGIAGASRLLDASTEGAALGISGFGQSFGPAFFSVWAVLVAFTGGVVWAARRCVRIKSIQSATGLYYVAILTAGVAEFLVRYLMLNAS